MAPQIRVWWNAHGTPLLRLAIIVMALDAVIWLGYEFWRLLLQPGLMGAVDLGNRHNEVHQWFARLPVYTAIPTAWYPPATYALLWPFVGWLDFTSARWLWAITTLLVMVWFAVLIVRGSGAQSSLERAFVVLISLATYPLGAMIGNGQLDLHVLAALITALLLLQQASRQWYIDLLVAFLLLTTLVKPNISAPFFWVALFLPGGLRPVVLASLGYLGVTFLAASFQEVGLLTLLRDWLAIISTVAVETGGITRYANIQTWLVLLHLPGLIFPASLLWFLGLAVWVYLHRRNDIWLLIGVAALVCRFWSYHRWYDDILIVLPMITLLRIAKRGPSRQGEDVFAGVLLAITVLLMLAPGGLFLLPNPFNVLYTSIETVLWLLILAFLLIQAQREPLRATTRMSAELAHV